MNYLNLAGELNNIPLHLNRQISKYVYKPINDKIDQYRYNYLPPANKVIRININDIQYWYKGRKYKRLTYPGQIKGGDWSDRLIPREERLNERNGYFGLIERFIVGKQWRDTRLFKEKYAKLLDQKGVVKGCDNLIDLEKYYEEKYDALYNNIKTNGLLPAGSNNPAIDPIYIHIGPRGELIYTMDGNHRFFIAKILGIEKMPVYVWMRHSRWQHIREHILEKRGKNILFKYRKYLKHPDIITELD